MVRACILSIVFLLVSAVPASALTPVQQQTLQSLETIKSTFATLYAPRAWKKKHLKWDLDKAIEKGKAQVRKKSNLSVAESRAILRDFFMSARDYHVSIHFYATEYAHLPLEIKGVDDRYFLVWVDRNKLSQTSFRFEPGTEVIKFGGRPVGDVVNEIKKTLGGNTGVTDQAFAESLLTRRSAAQGMAVPKGLIDLELKVDGKKTGVQLMWIHNEETVTPVGVARGNTKLKPLTPGERAGLQLTMRSHFGEKFEGDGAKGWNGFIPGNRDGFLPALGKIVVATGPKNPVKAYIYELPGEKLPTGGMSKPIKVGFIRIGTYAPDKPTPDEVVAAFKEAINKFETTVAVLVVDQTSNNGGYFSHMAALAGMLTPTPLVTPRHRIMLNPASIYFAERYLPGMENITTVSEAESFWGKSFSGYPVDVQFSQMRLAGERFNLEQWKKGNTFTQPTHIGGVDKIPSFATHFSKPILMLINELDISCGDFMPAVMQDNKRATLMGTRTSGAGGYVNTVKFPPNMLGIRSFSVTGSIAERVDKSPIENLGVKPDIEYQLTVRDFETGFKPYVKAINKVVRSMVPKPKTDPKPLSDKQTTK